MKKKLFIAMLIATMSFSIVACGSTTKEDTKTKSSKVDETKKSKESSTKSKTTENATENSEATNAPAFTYTDKSGSIYITQTVNVRDLPDTSGNKLTTIKAGTELILLGQCNETGWYKVEYANDKVGYVSNAYASTDKPAVQNNANSGANNSSPGNGGSTTNNNIQYSNEGVSTSGVPDGVTTQVAIAKANAMGYDIGVVHQAEDGHYYCYYIESGWPTEPGTSIDFSYGSGSLSDIAALSDYMTLRRCDFY